MNKFFLILWVHWLIRLTLLSTISACVISSIIITFIYFSQGAPTFTQEVQNALVDLFQFYYVIVWSATLLLYLFRTLKFIFNNCYNGYKLQLFSCPKEATSEVIKIIGYGDIVKVWRKWFLLMIWLVATQMLICIVFFKIFTSYENVFNWFNIYILYTFILFAGYFSFMILTSRCKRVKLIKC